MVVFLRRLQRSHRLGIVPRAGFDVCYCKPGFLGPSHPIPHFTLAICLRWGGLTSFLMSRSTSSLFFRAAPYIAALDSRRRYIGPWCEMLYTHRHGLFWKSGLREPGGSYCFACIALLCTFGHSLVAKCWKMALSLSLMLWYTSASAYHMHILEQEGFAARGAGKEMRGSTERPSQHKRALKG